MQKKRRECVPLSKISVLLSRFSVPRLKFSIPPHKESFLVVFFCFGWLNLGLRKKNLKLNVKVAFFLLFLWYPYTSQKNISPKIICQKNISLNILFPELTFVRNHTCQNEHLPEITSARINIFLNVHLPE